MRVTLLKHLGIQQSPGDERKAQQGKGPGNDGPPDLDQLWRDFNQRLNRMFGKRGGDGGGPYRPDTRGAGISAVVVAAIAGLIWLASGAFIVPDGQVGIVTSFGQYAYTATPGFNWSWPAPIQAHEIVNVSQVQTVEVGYRANIRDKRRNESLMLTGDENIVDVQFSVQYRIKEPVAWAFNNRDQIETMRGSAETAVREIVGRSKMDGLLYEGRDKLALEARRAIQQMLDTYKLGAEVSGVTVQALNPPEQVAGAFEDAVKAQEDRARAKSEAEGYAADILPVAKGKAAQMTQDAQAYRDTVVNNATGNAARFDQVVAEYTKAPQVTRDRMYLDTMEQIFANTSKIMIDARTANTVVLPLDKMLAQSAANDAAVGGRSGPMMAPQPPQANQQSQPQGQPQQQNQAAPQPPQQQQPQPQPQTQAPAQPDHRGIESVRQRDLRSRESSRERETR